MTRVVYCGSRRAHAAMITDIPGRSSSASPRRIFCTSHPAPASASPFPKRFVTRPHSCHRWLRRNPTSYSFLPYCKQTEPHTRCAHHRLTPLPRFVAWCFLKLVGWSYIDVLSAIFFMSSLGFFAYSVSANQRHLHRKLDDVSGRIQALQQSMRVGTISPRA